MDFRYNILLKSLLQIEFQINDHSVLGVVNFTVNNFTWNFTNCPFLYICFMYGHEVKHIQLKNQLLKDVVFEEWTNLQISKV